MRLNDIKTSFFLARRSTARGSWAVLLLTPFIIGLAITNLVFFTGLFAGIMEAVDRLVLDSMFSNILLEPGRDKHFIVSADSKLSVIEHTPGVAGTSPHYKASAVFSFDPEKDNKDVETKRYTVTSIEPAREQTVTRIHDYVVEGRYLTDDDRNQILIGAEVAGRPNAYFPKASLGGLRIGDKVRAVYENGISREYEVAGIYKVGSDVIDLGVYVTHKEMESVLGVRDVAHEIMVRTEQPGTEAEVVKELRNRGLTEEKISTWTEFLNYTATLRSSFTFLNVVTSVVSMIVVTVAVFIITFINIVNKRKQLGILRAMGLPDSTVTLSYVFQTLFACFFGILFSVILVFLIIAPISDAYPFNVGFGPFNLVISWRDLMFSASIVLATNLIAGFIPAVWAIRRETIIKAIWGV